MVQQAPIGRIYTYRDYLTWPFDERCELINGQAVSMEPAPGLDHQYDP